MKKIFLLLLMLNIALPLQSKVYKCIDKSGLPIFSNLPCVSANQSKKDFSFNIHFFPVKNKSDIAKWVKSNTIERKNFKYIKKLKRNIEIHLPVILTFKESQLNRRIKFILAFFLFSFKICTKS